MKKGISLLGAVQGFAVLYLIVWSIAPPLGIDLVYRLLALALAAVWAVIAFMRRIQLETIHIWALLFVLLIVFVTYVRYNSFSNIIKQIAWYILFVEFIFFSFYSKKNLWHEIELILPIVFLVFIFFNYKTAVVLIEDPTIARKIVRMDDDVVQLMRQGIGGYALVYSQVLMFPAALFWTLKAFRNDRIKFLIGIVWLVSYAFLIANASYSIALFSTFASLFVLLFYKGKSVVGVIVITMILFVGVMASIMYITPWREWLLVTFDGTAVAKKINDLVNPVDSGGEDSIQVRITQYIRSLQAMLQYPVVGTLWRSALTGTHSHVLDSFAIYGWFGGYLNIKMIYSAPNYYKNKYDNFKAIISVANAELVVMIFISLFDTLTFEMMCPLFILVPLIMEDIKNWTGDKYENSLVSKSRSRSGG